MSDIIKRDLDPESSVVSTAHRCGMWLWRHNLRCSANLFLISSIRLFIALSPPPFNSALCINPLVQQPCQKLRQTCIALTFCFSRENVGFIEENESVVSEMLFVIHRYDEASRFS